MHFLVMESACHTWSGCDTANRILSELSGPTQLQRKVDKWGPEELHRWLSNVGLEAYADILRERNINGPVHACNYPRTPQCN